MLNRLKQQEQSIIRHGKHIQSLVSEHSVMLILQRGTHYRTNYDLLQLFQLSNACLRLIILTRL